MGRALIFSDPKVVDLVRTRFVACAVRTGWYLAPEEEEFLKQINHPGGTFVCVSLSAHLSGTTRVGLRDGWRGSDLAAEA